MKDPDTCPHIHRQSLTVPARDGSGESIMTTTCDDCGKVLEESRGIVTW